MGLSGASSGINAAQKHFLIKEGTKTVALAGNPNVGKSTVFNALTGLHQHTGNWPGKTVTYAVGQIKKEGSALSLVDLPGTYSLFPHSKEEAVARDFLCFQKLDAVVVVCDATALERSLALVLQVLQITSRVVVCLNLCDEAKKKNICIDSNVLSKQLGVPVIETAARAGRGIERLKAAIFDICEKNEAKPIGFCYDTAIETALGSIQGLNKKNNLFLKLQLLLEKEEFIKLLEDEGVDIEKDLLCETVNEACTLLSKKHLPKTALSDAVALTVLKKAEEIAKISTEDTKRNDSLDRRLDKIFTGKKTGIPVMLALLCLVFYITVYASSYPSQLLSQLLFPLGDKLRAILSGINTPWWITEPLVDGVYKTMAWVVCVMLPPMAIFFPLFTLLEDFGYLPRVAFNLDHCFKRCNACGKQSLCMCMGLGCNAAGVVGCRIIDSKRERLIAILTNSFIPCNGRFPTIIAIISMFFVATLSPKLQSLAAAGILTLIIVLGVAASLVASYLLSVTLLKGEKSSFTLELPPYRVPKIGSVIVRSIFDRTVYVLARAVCVSAPMGLVIWLLANVSIGSSTLIVHLSSFFEPLGRLLGLDGILILAFILGLPANEIVLPIAMMCYENQSVLTELSSNASIYSVLTQNGWTAVTGICFILFSLMHYPCSTTIMTIYKETKSLKWTAVSILLPTAFGAAACMLINLIF